MTLRFESSAWKEHMGKSSDDCPFGRDDVQTWARKQARIAVDVAKHNFENELIGLHGNWDAGAIDFEALVDMFESAAWDVVRKVEAE